ncbi:MAG: hypothetical protein AAF340_09695 [Pseudomonadota bacterium]
MSQEVIDLIRIGHLVFFALGMGAGLYFDLRSLRRINTPFTNNDLAEFTRVHHIVFGALLGLWVTGFMLLYIRTGFDLNAFTPKLQLKLIIVSALSLNAAVIGTFVLPRVGRAVGKAALDLPLREVLPMTMSASASLFCWLSGLVLGASVTFKTAGWATLGSFFAAEFVVIVFGASGGFLILHAVMRRRGSLSKPMALTPEGQLTQEGSRQRSAR